MRSAQVFWGIVLAIFGLILLLLNLGLLPSSFWGYMWALALIVFGLWLLLGPWLTRNEKKSKHVSFPVEDLREAEIKIEHGAGRLEVHATSDSGFALMDGVFGGGVETDFRRDGAVGRLAMKVPGDVFMAMPWLTYSEGLNWNIGLNRSIPLRLKINMGAGETKLDLVDLQVKDLQIETGASSTQVRLPASVGHTRAVFKSGAASMDIRIPEQVSARIEVKSGLSGVNVDENRFIRHGDVYQSADYETAVNRVDILAETGVGSLDIR